MRIVTGVLLVAAAACGGDLSAPTPTVPLFSSGDFSIAVAAGTRPVFSWTGGNANYITVGDYPDGTAIAPTWDAYSSSPFQPPVAYGTFPSGAHLYLAPNLLDLQRGKHYLVCVVRVDQRAACQEFVP